jgi:hypothetical protein|tara:strand:+ start:6174 stop:6992 length:819 start_codon:yes stop_codon:yes gene_type:complete
MAKEKIKFTDRSNDIVETSKELKEKVSTNLEDNWVFKDRTYYLKNRMAPLSHIIKAADIYYFDKEKGYERELKYTRNQTTCFVDEMHGEQRLDHIVFRDGILSVPKNKTTLQKLLSLYHPLKDSLYEEFDAVREAVDELSTIEMEIEALNAAQSLEVDVMEAVMRVELGSKVSGMSSKELKRDTLIYAKRNPSLFLELVNDENVVLRNFGIKATEMGIIKISNDQRTFTWVSNGRKLLNVPFDEHPYSALAAWFKTDEGMEIYSNIEKRFNS